MRWTVFRLCPAVLVALAVSLVATPAHGRGPGSPGSGAPAVTFYAGIFPAFTAADQSVLQRSVDGGHRPWMVVPALVAEAFANFVHWPHTGNAVRRESQRGDAALVSVGLRGVPGHRLFIRLTRPGQRTDGIWSVVGCYTHYLRLEQPGAGQYVTSPLAVRGHARVFEGTITLDITDASLRPLGQGTGHAQGQVASPFSGTIVFRSVSRYAIIEASTRSARDGSLFDLAMTKVVLGGS